MTTALMERPTEIHNERNHSCTSQCSVPCQYITSEVECPEIGITASPEMTRTGK
jgi:hypothetical protein